MKEADIPTMETKRMEALLRHDILDTPPDGSFDHITALAAAIFKVPISLITLVDTDRIWFKSHYGLSIDQINRGPGLCASAILSNDVYIVENAIEDPRSLANPLVAGEFGLRFYAAVPLQTEDNFNLGTLCIIDKEPRVLTAEEKKILQQLGRIVMDEMSMRLAFRNTVFTIKNLSADIAAHLNETIKKVEAGFEKEQTNELLSHLDASRLFLANVDNQLNDL